MKGKNWFTFQSKAAGVLDISIHDEIGLFGIRASDFMANLKASEEAQVINLSVHSPGGDLNDGIAMYSALRAHPAKVYGRVEGIAASAASIVLMAADNIAMPEDAYLMIHNPWTVAIGDADELRAIADVADKFQTTMVNIYERRTGMDRDAIAALMAEETYITAAEAMEMNFADTIADPVKVAAKLVAFEKYFKQLPVESDSDIIRIEALQSINDLETFLREAGEFSRKAAKALVARSKLLAERDARSVEQDEAEILEALNRIKVPESLSGAM